VFFWFFIGFILLQRLTELVLAKRNKKIMLAKGAVEFDKAGYRLIVLMHVLFFISLTAERNYLHRGLNDNWILLIALFALAQVLRYWAITTLGEFWNTKIIVLKGSEIIKKGPYKYLNHPNYTAVITEIAVIPLIFSCYITAIVFSVLNLIALRRRIKIEEAALKTLTA
jgi:methyltransferase